MIRLLHDTLAVPSSRRARLDRDAVVLRHGGERGAHLPGARGDHRRHPVKAPVPAQATQSASDPVQAIDQERLLLGLAQHRPPHPRMRQRPNEQVRGLAPPPVLGRVGQLDPVPLGLLTRWVLDQRRRASLERRARLARRAQAPGAQRPRERLIRPVVTELEHLVVQGAGPHVWIVLEPLRAVHLDPVERLHPRALAHSRFAAVQIGADRLAVPAQVPGDRADRPAPLGQCMYLDVVLPCEHEQWGSFVLVRGQRPPASKEPHPTRWSHTGGEFQ
jgi:hypothetical protein